MNKSEDNHRKFADWLDRRFTIPGTGIRFGIDPILGLIPGAGDWFAGVISLYFLIQAAIKGGSSAVLGRMFINILLDVLIGSIPVLGDLFDVYWKANLRNARILDKLKQNSEKTTSESRLWIWLVLILLSIILIGILLLIGWVIAELLDLIF